MILVPRRLSSTRLVQSFRSASCSSATSVSKPRLKLTYSQFVFCAMRSARKPSSSNFATAAFSASLISTPGWSRTSSETSFSGSCNATPSGQSAPSLIHLRISSTCSSVRFSPSAGMRLGSSASRVMSSRSKLSSAFPTVIPGSPLPPPARMASLESRRKSPFGDSLL